MTVYDSMIPFENLPEHEHKVSERPSLHLATPETTPNKAQDDDFDWNQWKANIKPASPQSLPSLDHPLSPTSEDLSQLPKCRKCGLTTNQHKFVQAYICGHLCRDIAQDHFCPDIDALHLSSKDCPIHSPRKTRLTRRRSSLSKPPMLAGDESTYEDLDTEQLSFKVSESPVDVNKVREDTTPIKNDQNKASDMPPYHVSCDTCGEADWRKHCRVEKAMQQMLFGDARVSAHIMLEHTQRLRGNESISTAQDHHGDHDAGLYPATTTTTAADKIDAEQDTNESGEQSAAIGEKYTEVINSFKAAQAQAQFTIHNPDCAICSDGEEEAEDGFRDEMSVARSATKVHGCESDDECSSCAGDRESSSVDSRDFAVEQPPQMWMDRSRAC